MRLWRIAGASYKVWSGEGARQHGARWNPPGLPAIYTGTSYAIAALEILVHANAGSLPKTLRYIEADVPDPLSAERVDTARLDEWCAPDITAAREFGRTWLLERRSLVLLVPSVVTRGLDWNAMVNPQHPDFPAIAVSAEAQAAWDPRLQQKSKEGSVLF